MGFLLPIQWLVEMTAITPSKSPQPEPLAAVVHFRKNALSASWMTSLSSALEADYLRRQADTCLRIARATFDLTTAERLRFLAVELRSKATELDDEATLEPPLQPGNGSPTSRAGRK